jgi:hypothetical protein
MWRGRNKTGSVLGYVRGGGTKQAV